MVDTMNSYNITILRDPLSQFCLTYVSVDMRYIQRIWPHRIWLVILLIPRRMRGHNMWNTLPRHIFTHLAFPSVRVVFSVTFIPGFVMIMDLWYLINWWRAVISFLILIVLNTPRWIYSTLYRRIGLKMLFGMTYTCFLFQHLVETVEIII